MRKKSTSIESKRPLLFAAGLLFAVSLTLVSFEWRTPYEPAPFVCEFPTNQVEGEWVLPIQLSDPEPKVEKPKPPEKTPELTNQIDVVENDVDTKSDEELAISLDDLPDFKDDYSDEEESDTNDDPIEPERYVSEMPKYCGGETAMFEYLSKHLTYPEIPRTNGVSGTVHVEFVVGKNGKLRDAKVVRPIDPWLDAEALRVAKLLDCFTPGLQGGKAVDVYFVLPIRFALSR